MRRIETSLVIDAAVAKVWVILTAFGEYAAWNPFVIAAEGRAVPGARLQVTIRPPGRKPTGFRPVVLAATPERELRWRGRVLMPGLFDGEHYFGLDAAGGGCRFTQGEVFSGLLAGVMGNRFYDCVRQGFEAMNAALKSRAEA